MRRKLGCSMITPAMPAFVPAIREVVEPAILAVFEPAGPPLALEPGGPAALELAGSDSQGMLVARVRVSNARHQVRRDTLGRLGEKKRMIG